MSGVAAPPGSPAPGPAHGGSLAPDTQTWPVSRVSLPHRRLGSTRCLPGTAAAAGGGSARLPGSPGWISVTCLACPPPCQPRAARPRPPGDPPLPPAGTRPDWSHCPRFQARFLPVRWELLPRSWFPSGSSRELGEVGSHGSQASPPRRCPPGPRSPWARPTSARMPPRDPRSPGHRETAWAGCWFWVTEFRWPLGRRSPQHAVNHLVSSVGRASQGLPGSALVGGAWGGLLWHPEGLRVRAPWIKMLRVAPYLSPPGCSVPTSGVHNGRAGGGRRPVFPAAASLP